MSSTEVVKTSKNELRKFGTILTAALAIWGGYFLMRGKGHEFWFFGVSACIALATALLPISLAPVHTAFMAFSRVSGWVVTRLILIVLFYTILTPIGIVGRLLGKHFLDVKMDASRGSYWIATQPKAREREIYERQF